MSQEGEYAGNVELAVLAKLTQHDIVVYDGAGANSRDGKRTQII
jgi:hypothetical protein